MRKFLHKKFNFQKSVKISILIALTYFHEILQQPLTTHCPRLGMKITCTSAFDKALRTYILRIFLSKLDDLMK